MSYNDAAGHLATITSLAEAEFIWDQWRCIGYDNPGSSCENCSQVEELVWIGGTDAPDNNSDPADGWTWITGEAWSWTSWNDGEPNDNGDSYGDENCAPVLRLFLR